MVDEAALLTSLTCLIFILHRVAVTQFRNVCLFKGIFDVFFFCVAYLQLLYVSSEVAS